MFAFSQCFLRPQLPLVNSSKLLMCGRDVRWRQRSVSTLELNRHSGLAAERRRCDRYALLLRGACALEPDARQRPMKSVDLCAAWCLLARLPGIRGCRQRRSAAGRDRPPEATQWKRAGCMRLPLTGSLNHAKPYFIYRIHTQTH